MMNPIIKKRRSGRLVINLGTMTKGQYHRYLRNTAKRYGLKVTKYEGQREIATDSVDIWRGAFGNVKIIKWAIGE